MIDWKYEILKVGQNVGLDLYLPTFNKAPILSILDKIDSEKHRKYHTLEHVYDLFARCMNNMPEKYEDDRGAYTRIVFLFAVFHDAVYEVVPSGDKFTNEWKSAELFKSKIEELGDTLTIDECDIICRSINSSRVNTKRDFRYVRTDYENFPWLIQDRIGVLETLTSNDRRYLEQIIEEYSFYEFNDFAKAHMEVAEHILLSLGVVGAGDFAKYENILYSYCPKNIAIYCGSFNPFHLGHLNIVEKAEETFDKVVVAKGFNPDKVQLFDEKTIELNRQLVVSSNYRESITYTGTIFDLYEYYTNKGYKVTFIKGFRNSDDIEYDLNQYRVIRDINPKINFMFIPCDVEYLHISSSMIRNLEKLNMNDQASRYLCK